MTARPWPHRYTRARLGGLTGFVVRPRMGPIALDPDETDLIVDHGGWSPPFEDENEEPNLVDGVNPGQPLSLSRERVTDLHDFGALDGSGPHYNVRKAKGKREGNHRHGVVDWRSSDGKHVLSWVGTTNRYAAPGTGASTSQDNGLWYRGRKNGAIPDGGDLDDGIHRPVKGACRYVDPATGTAWFVAVVFVLTDSLRQNNDYTEEVWMRRAGRDFQDAVTTDADIDALIQDVENPALKDAQQENLEALRAELGKWQRVAAIDADALLPAPPTGDPKVAPLNGDVAYWLFNASGNECQTIRMVMASENGTFDPGSWQAQDQQRLQINLAYTITEQVVAGETFYRPAATVSQAQAFAALSGTVSSSRVVTVTDTVESKEIWDYDATFCTGAFHDVIMAKNASNDITEDEDWTYTFAVDYVGDQEVFASYHFTRDYDRSISVSAAKNTLERCGDPEWSDTGSSTRATFFTLVETEIKETSYDVNGVLFTLESTLERSIQQNDELQELPALPWEYDATTGPNGDAPKATEFIDETVVGVGIRYLDLRLGILHYTRSSEVLDDDTDSEEIKSKDVAEIVHINGLEETLQTDIDSRTLDNRSRQDTRFDADPTEADESDAGPATFANSSVAAGYYGIAKRSVGWDRDADGNYIGSAILGEGFRPYGSIGFGPHGHETVFNRYDGAADSVQDLFGIQPVNAGDVFVCYPVAFVGA